MSPAELLRLQGLLSQDSAKPSSPSAIGKGKAEGPLPSELKNKKRGWGPFP